MSAYGDYKKLCPKTFTKGFSVLASYDAPGKPVGQSFYIAKVPEMDKIGRYTPFRGQNLANLLASVIVFKGNSLDGLDWTPVSISGLVSNCKDCTVAKAVYDLYMYVAVAFLVMLLGFLIHLTMHAISPQARKEGFKRLQGSERCCNRYWTQILSHRTRSWRSCRRTRRHGNGIGR